MKRDKRSTDEQLCEKRKELYKKIDEYEPYPDEDKISEKELEAETNRSVVLPKDSQWIKEFEVSKEMEKSFYPNRRKSYRIEKDF